MKVAPAKALLGYLPVLNPLTPLTTRNERIEERAEQVWQSREQAKEALDRAARHMPEDQFKEGEQVWLEAKNLALPYQTRKLTPKHHGCYRQVAVSLVVRVSPVRVAYLGRSDLLKREVERR